MASFSLAERSMPPGACLTALLPTFVLEVKNVIPPFPVPAAYRPASTLACWTLPTKTIGQDNYLCPNLS